jgi:leader peptidase (prepilin peptidase)/N-methyltransferase
LFVFYDKIKKDKKIFMSFLFYLFIFLFGLAVGSFLNVLILRLGSEVKKGIGGRSHCPKCGHQLGWQDLIPVLSFVMLGGKCRYCGQKISWQYPIVELATGILFVFLLTNFWSLGFGHWDLFGIWSLGFGIFITSCLIVIFVSDLKFFIIPDEIIIAGSIAALIYRLSAVFNFEIWNLFRNWKLEIGNWQTVGYHLLAAIAAGTFFLAIVLATNGKGMGLGDVKMAFLMGLVLGWPLILPALLLAFVAGALVGLGLIAAGRAKMKSEIPFGTFLAAATFLVMIWGGGILTELMPLLFY